VKRGKARMTTQDGREVARFDAVTSRAALPPGDYIVEVNGNKIPFPATEGEVLEGNVTVVSRSPARIS
jgi:hypothetical protein